MAVHNGGTFLDGSIESIVRQTFTDWELVVVDDASTDGSAQLVDRWTGKDRRIRVVSKAKNQGQTASLNEGLAVCRGRWVARQDADDISLPHRLADQVAYLSQRPGTVLLGAQGKLIDRKGALIGLLDVPCERCAIEWCAPILNPFLHTAVIFDRKAAEAAGGYDPAYRIAQDYDLWARLSKNHQVANLPERLVCYRNTEQSLSRASRDLALAEADRVSARVSLDWLGRSWSESEKHLVRGFRRGLLLAERKDFWELIGRLEQEKGIPCPRRLRAAWHLRVAGSAAGARLSESLSALGADPFFTLGWLAERLSGASSPDA